MENELQGLQNTTAKLGKEVETLKQLKNVQQLQDLNVLKQEVQSISSQTHALDVNQQTINLDFLSLYNQTIINQNKLKSLGKQQEADKNETMTFLQNIKTDQNRSRAILYGKIDTIDKNMNNTYAEFKEKANEKGKLESRMRLPGDVDSRNNIKAASANIADDIDEKS
ncbi:unnamed protein product [Mytilus coruscus]|uniref:Uncharacterized protein n=1 Tax=Mytilus coruscus TaxID=42192 RepID=A0A6J8DFA0_MYTCO|nr:unnamed protein product [Mytilus coruscus]